MIKHVPVLLNEVLGFIETNSEGIFVDATLGSGGHSLKILEKLKNGTLICFDVDIKNIEQFKMRLGIDFEKNRNAYSGKLDNKKIILINDNFVKIADYLNDFNIKKVNFILADLGWSIDQLGQIEGLSYKSEEQDLDMRLSKDLSVKASDLLNILDRGRLEKLFLEYSDIRGNENKRLVNEIITYRNKKTIQKVFDLLQITNRAFSVGGNKEKRVFNARNNPKAVNSNNLSKVFQALRIAVNLELKALEHFTKASIEILEIEGILLVITFHSGEEKILRDALQSFLTTGSVLFAIKNSYGDYFRPSVLELRNNLSARSAKLFAIRKIK